MGLGAQGLAAGGETGHGHETGMNFKQNRFTNPASQGQGPGIAGARKTCQAALGQQSEGFYAKGLWNH